MPNSTICVDARLIVRFLVPGQFTAEARANLEIWRQAGMSLLAPILLEYEVSAALRRMFYQKTIAPLEGDRAFSVFEGMNINLSNDKTPHRRAWQLAKRFNQSRTYDMSYVALAELNDCPFWMTDERLYNSVRHQLKWVHWIGEWASITLSH